MSSVLPASGPAVPAAPSEGLIPGHLERGQEHIPVALARGTRLSPVIKSRGGRQIPLGEFHHLTLELAQGQATIAKVKVESEADGIGRLVCLAGVYDFDALFDSGAVVDISNFMKKVPLVLSQKDSISAAFKAYCADLIFSLSVYEKFFNEQDRIYASERPSIHREAQRVLLEHEGRRFFVFFDQELARLNQLVEGLEREAYERHGTYFRRVLWDFIIGSEFLKRTNLKPRGYAGDAEMMRLVYENSYVGRYVFNMLLHKHPLETPAAQAVRSRRGLVVGAMRAISAARAGSTALRCFSVACGPAWELRDLFRGAEDARRWQPTLLDQDEEALASAKQCLGEIEVAVGHPISVQYVSDSVRTMLRTADLSARFGRFDFIYSMGLFDYLTPPVAKALLGRLFELVNPGGAILVGNYHLGHPTRHYMAFWMDWVLYLRSEADMLALAAGIPDAKASLSFDDTGSQMFLRLDRP